jgi:hypothetical protein
MTLAEHVPVLQVKDDIWTVGWLAVGQPLRTEFVIFAGNLPPYIAAPCEII